MPATYTGNALFEQADGALSFAVAENANRPVRYKMHQPVQIQFHTPSSSLLLVGPPSYEPAAVRERTVSEP